jgi:hypothetical protein
MTDNNQSEIDDNQPETDDDQSEIDDNYQLERKETYVKADPNTDSTIGLIFITGICVSVIITIIIGLSNSQPKDMPKSRFDALISASNTPGNLIDQYDIDMLEIINKVMSEIDITRLAPNNYHTYYLDNYLVNNNHNKEFIRELLRKGYNVIIYKWHEFYQYTIKWGVDFTAEEDKAYRDEKSKVEFQAVLCNFAMILLTAIIIVAVLVIIAYKCS